MPVAGPLLDLGIGQAAEPRALAVGGRPSEHREARDLDPGRRPWAGVRGGLPPYEPGLGDRWGDSGAADYPDWLVLVCELCSHLLR